MIFFVSVGMLFDPTHPRARAARGRWPCSLIILIGKSIAAFVIVQIMGYPIGTALTVSASASRRSASSRSSWRALGISLGIFPPTGRDLILAGALCLWQRQSAGVRARQAAAALDADVPARRWSRLRAGAGPPAGAAAGGARRQQAGARQGDDSSRTNSSAGGRCSRTSTSSSAPSC